MAKAAGVRSPAYSRTGRVGGAQQGQLVLKHLFLEAMQSQHGGLSYLF